ncbi:MAG: hypothetical protein K0Q52_3118 [Microbacterium sp.]|jgi:uncharacterized protein YycO|nr:hypothetical protein [Microbacterium sp.]
MKNKKKVGGGFVAVMMAGAILASGVPANAAVSPGASQNATTAVSAGRINISHLQNAAADLRTYAASIRATTNVKTRQEIARKANNVLDGLRYVYTGSSARLFNEAAHAFKSFAIRGLWNTSAVKLESIAKGINATANNYIDGERRPIRF